MPTGPGTAERSTARSTEVLAGLVDRSGEGFLEQVIGVLSGVLRCISLGPNLLGQGEDRAHEDDSDVHPH